MTTRMKKTTTEMAAERDAMRKYRTNATRRGTRGSETNIDTCWGGGYSVFWFHITLKICYQAVWSSWQGRSILKDIQRSAVPDAWVGSNCTEPEPSTLRNQWQSVLVWKIPSLDQGERWSVHHPIEKQSEHVHRRKWKYESCPHKHSRELICSSTQSEK